MFSRYWSLQFGCTPMQCGRRRFQARKTWRMQSYRASTPWGFALGHVLKFFYPEKDGCIVLCCSSPLRPSVEAECQRQGVWDGGLMPTLHLPYDEKTQTIAGRATDWLTSSTIAPGQNLCLVRRYAPRQKLTGDWQRRQWRTKVFPCRGKFVKHVSYYVMPRPRRGKVCRPIAALPNLSFAVVPGGVPCYPIFAGKCEPSKSGGAAYAYCKRVWLPTAEQSNCYCPISWIHQPDRRLGFPPILDQGNLQVQYRVGRRAYANRLVVGTGRACHGQSTNAAQLGRVLATNFETCVHNQQSPITNQRKRGRKFGTPLCLFEFGFVLPLSAAGSVPTGAWHNSDDRYVFPLSKCRYKARDAECHLLFLGG